MHCGMWTSHRDYDTYEALASFQPDTALPAGDLGYLKTGDLFLVNLSSKRQSKPGYPDLVTEFIGAGERSGLVFADMDGWVISEHYGELADLKEGREPRKRDYYINVRTPNFEVVANGEYTNFTIYEAYARGITVSRATANEIRQRKAEVEQWRSGKARATQAQAEIDRARKMIRDAEAILAKARSEVA